MIDSITAALPVLETLGERSEAGYWNIASQYGEPGYSDASLVVLGSYWCHCDGDLHDVFSRHYPHLAERFKDLGIKFEWDDEWIIDHEADKAFRTSPDSYSWQPSFVITDDGDLITIDDDFSEILEWSLNNATRCIPANFGGTDDLTAAGFTQYEYDGQPPYESGWHPGQTDDPYAIETAARQASEVDLDVVFFLDESSQFYVRFTCWVRGVES